MKARPHRACLKAFLWRHSRACCGACPVAILTDGDAANIGGAPSATAIALEAKEAEIPNLHVEYSAITFEHELARSAAILPLMLDAFGTLHPINGASLKAKVNALATGDAIPVSYTHLSSLNPALKILFYSEYFPLRKLPYRPCLLYTSRCV